jgi:hypothetical protein
VFIRAMYLIAANVECRFVAEHAPRKSDWETHLADRLSRRSTMTRKDIKLTNSFTQPAIPECLRD